MATVDVQGQLSVELLEDFAIWSKGLVQLPTFFIPYTISYNAMKAQTRISKEMLMDVIEEEMMMTINVDTKENLSQTQRLV